jgi:ABC-type multidrug transport system fused ATPase/permease subunit
MLRELSSAYHTVDNRAQALVTRAIQYYTKDTPLNTAVVYAAIKIIVLLGAILVSLHSQPSALLQNPVFLAKWDGVLYRGIAYQGYAYGYPFTAAFPPMYPLLIKIFSLNQPTLMPWVEVLISNAFSFLGLYFLYKLVPFIVNEKYRLRVCFAYMVFPVLLVCNLVSYSEPIFLAFTIGAYYYWKREKFGYAALLAIFSIFTRQVGAFILVIFLVDMLYAYFSHRERSRVIRQLAVIAITCAGVAMLYLFYLYRFGNPFIVSRVEAEYWLVTFALTNIFHNVGVLGFGGPGFWLWPRLVPFNYAVVPIFLVDTLLVVATILALLKKDLALSVYSFVSLAIFLSEVSWPNSFVRYIAAIFPLYIFLGLMLSDNWQKNIVIGVIAVVIAIQNMFTWISGAWLY